MPLATTNLTIDAIKTYINNSSNDVGTLCLDASIDMFSKKKPVRYENSNSSIWYEGVNSDYSIDIPQYTQGGVTTDWTYNKPVGGAASPYDMGHFRGYENTALCPLIQPVSSVTHNKWSSATQQLAYLKEEGTLYQIGVDDLQYNSITLEDMYFAVELSQTGQSTQYITSDTSVGVGNSIALDWDTAPLSSWDDDDITAKFFLTSKQKSISDSIPVGFWTNACVIPNSYGSYRQMDITLENDTVLSVSIYEVGATKTGTFYDPFDTIATPVVSLNPASVKMWITNNSGSSYTLYASDLSWEMRDVYNGLDYTVSGSGRLFNTSGTAVSSISIGAGSTTTLVLYDSTILHLQSSPDSTVATAIVEHKGALLCQFPAGFATEAGGGLPEEP